MKRQIIGLILILSLILVSGCTPSAEEPAVTPDAEKVLTVLQGIDAVTLDPAMHMDTPTGNAEYQNFDTVLRRNNDMVIEGNVATEWQIIDDLTWQFMLRDDVYFHDGVQLTANDIKFSIERILNPDNASARISNYSMISEVIVDNDFQITIKTAEPTPVLLSRMVDLRIVPKHYVEEVGNQEFSLNPVGSGPYKFSLWDKGERIQLIANEDYWDGAPEIKTVVFKPVPEPSSRVMALESGEADIITDVPPHQIAELEQADDVGVARIESTRVIFITITTANEAVQDVRIRQAINYAINRDSIVENLLGGNATVSSQLPSKFDLGYNTTIEPWEYSPEKARQLLAEAGVEGTLKLNFKSPSGRYIMDKEVAEAVAGQLEEVGIDVNLQFEEWGNYVNSIIGGTMDADIWLIGWGSSTFDAGTTLKQFLHTSLNTAYYDVDAATNEQVDQWIDDALMTLDADERVELYHKITNQANQDAAFVNLYQQNSLYGVSSRIEWQPRGDELIDISAASWK